MGSWFLKSTIKTVWTSDPPEAKAPQTRGSNSAKVETYALLATELGASQNFTLAAWLRTGFSTNS